MRHSPRRSGGGGCAARLRRGRRHIVSGTKPSRPIGWLPQRGRDHGRGMHALLFAGLLQCAVRGEDDAVLRGGRPSLGGRYGILHAIMGTRLPATKRAVTRAGRREFPVQLLEPRTHGTGPVVVRRQPVATIAAESADSCFRHSARGHSSLCHPKGKACARLSPSSEPPRSPILLATASMVCGRRDSGLRMVEPMSHSAPAYLAVRASSYGPIPTSGTSSCHGRTPPSGAVRDRHRKREH